MVNILSDTPINISRLKKAGLLLWSFMIIVQWLWKFEQQDIIATFLTLMGGLIGVSVLLSPELLAAYPISTFMMLGYLSYYFLLPPLATFIEGKSLTNNLYHPDLVLLHAFVCLLFLIAAYTIYRRWRFFQGLRWIVARKIYQPFGLFRFPSNLHLFLMGIIGLIAMGFQIFVVGIYQNDILGISNKFLQGLYPLAYLPYVILVRTVTGPNGRISRKWFLILSIYTVLIVFVSMGQNSRSAFLIGAASILLAYFYGLAVGLYKANAGTIRKILLLVFGLLVLSGPITDLALSMVIVRGKRADISALDLVAETIKVYQNKETLRSSRLDAVGNRSFWDWWYVDNIFMARLANLKLADNSIDLALSMGKITKSYIRDIELQRVLSAFPRPIIDVFDLPVDKDLVEPASSGDFMLYAVTGNPYVLGGFRAGSIFGNGYALFGWWYPLIFSALALLLFPLEDALTTRLPISQIIQTSNEWIPVLAPVVIVDLFSRFFYLTSAATGSESLSSLASYLVRGWLQVLFVYALIYWITYIPLKIFGRSYVELPSSLSERRTSCNS